MARKELDYNQLDKYINIHCTARECAQLFEMSEDTLDRRLKEKFDIGFAEYYAQKASEGKASLRRRQVELAYDGNATMLIWLGKQWLGQVDKAESTVTTKQIQINIDSQDSGL